MIVVTANEIFHKKEKVKHEWSTASDKPLGALFDLQMFVQKEIL